MTEPDRLLTGSGPAARLLRSAELDTPSARSRHRALAAAAGAATIVTAGSSAAMGGAALVKSAAIWLCVGAVSGGTVAAVTSYVSGSAEQRPLVASAPAKAPAVPAASPKPVTVPEAPAPIELPITEVEAPPAARSGSSIAPAEQALPIVPPGGSVAAFDVPNARPGLYEELKWLEAARGAAGRGDYASALATLDRYDTGYPAGHFRPESMALRVEALSRLGNHNAARALAERFRKSYPSHPLLSRVRAAVGD